MNIIYHKIDADGVASAALLKMYFETTSLDINLIPFNWGDVVDVEKLIGDTWIVDCSLHYTDMIKLKGSGSVIWVDHHISVINESIEYGYHDIPGLRCTGFAACELVYRYLLIEGFKSKIKYQHLLYIGLYDSFAGMKCPEIKDNVMMFSLGIRVCNYLDIDNMIAFLRGEDLTFDAIVTKGKVVNEYLTIEASKTAGKGKHMQYNTTDDNGKSVVYDVLLYSGDRLNLFNYLPESSLEKFHIVACSDDAIGATGALSLYSNKVDVSIIAKMYNGGGHKGAAGISGSNVNRFIRYALNEVHTSNSNDHSFDL